MVREPDERAATCVVSALEGQGIPWALQHILIASVADEIRAAITDERDAVAATLDIKEINKEALIHLRDLAREMNEGAKDVKSSPTRRRRTRARAAKG